MSFGESGSWRPGGAAGAAAVTLVLMGGLLLLLLPSASARTDPAPVLLVQLGYQNYSAEFQGGGPAILSITGRASIDKVPVERCAMTAWSTNDAGWQTLVSPSTMVFTSTNPQSFTITVIVPQGTPQNLSATLWIFCRYPRTAVANDSAIITVGPWHGVRAVVQDPVQFAGPGQAPRFTAVVTNTGNAVDMIRCGPGIEPWNHYSARRSYTANSSFLLDMAPGESRKISFTGHFNKGGFGQPEIITFSFPVYSMDPENRSQVLQDLIILTLYVEPDLWGWVDVPTVAIVLWGISMFALIVSVLRRKGQKSLRVPALKEAGQNDRP